MFFVYPHNVIKDGVVDKLIEQDYEVYILDDFKDIKYVCKNYSNPYIYINIDEGLDQIAWKVLITEIMEDDKLNHAKLGIITHNKNENLARTYLFDMMVPCGFIVLEQGLVNGTKQILGILDANEVNKERCNIRIGCVARNVTFNLKLKGSLCHGEVLELSSVGMTIIFDDNILITKFSNFNNIQLRLTFLLVLIIIALIIFTIQKDLDLKVGRCWGLID